MYDSGKIIAGLIVFVGLISSPFWYDGFSGPAHKNPDIVLPTGKNQQECVESQSFMLKNHMRLLNEWRQAVVREGKTTYTSTTGKTYAMNLEESCLNCHLNTSEFCDRCHNYMGVSLTCWSCHNENQNQNKIQFDITIKRAMTNLSNTRKPE